jgi:hypothetical protein
MTDEEFRYLGRRYHFAFQVFGEDASQHIQHATPWIWVESTYIFIIIQS